MSGGNDWERQEIQEPEHQLRLRSEAGRLPEPEGQRGGRGGAGGPRQSEGRQQQGGQQAQQWWSLQTLPGPPQ